MSTGSRSRWTNRIKSRIMDWAFTRMDPMRPDTVELVEGEVLEVGFGTGCNLRHYGAGVKSVMGLDPSPYEGLDEIEERIAEVSFPVERCVMRADDELPFDTARFDNIVTTWTLCSIPDAAKALAEMRRVLKPGGRYVFVEHGRAEASGIARWQDRLNPYWVRLTDGCHMNRAIDRIVDDAGFELTELSRFRGRGPSLLSQMFRGVATRV